MDCPHCHAELFEDAKYCASCGRKITLKDTLGNWSKKIIDQTKQAVDRVKGNLAVTVDNYIQELQSGSEVKIAGVKVPTSRKSTIENALSSFQNRWLANELQTEKEYEEWTAALGKRLEDHNCIVCFGKWETDQDIVVCPHCESGGHRDHLDSWIKQYQFCPLCRQELSLKQMVKISFTQ